MDASWGWGIISYPLAFITDALCSLFHESESESEPNNTCLWKALLGSGKCSEGGHFPIFVTGAVFYEQLVYSALKS